MLFVPRHFKGKNLKFDVFAISREKMLLRLLKHWERVLFDRLTLEWRLMRLYTWRVLATSLVTFFQLHTVVTFCRPTNVFSFCSLNRSRHGTLNSFMSPNFTRFFRAELESLTSGKTYFSRMKDSNTPPNKTWYQRKLMRDIKMY